MWPALIANGGPTLGNPTPIQEKIIMLRKATTALALASIIAAPVQAANVSTGDLLELVDFSKLTVLRDSVCTQVSSFDRTGGNDDGFSGRFSYLRMEDGKQVLFDADGPGCIYRIWSANPNDKKLEFFFEGSDKPGLVFDKFQDMFQGKVSPFLPPLSQHFIGGWCSYVPIPFQKHLKIVSHGQNQFLQITWHKFSSQEGVKSFPAQSADDLSAKFATVKKVWSDPGTAPWGENTPANWKTYDIDLTVDQGKVGRLLSLPGTGVVRAMYLKVASDDPRHYRECVLEVRTDGLDKPNVYCPIGDFFLDGFGWAAGRSILAGKRDGSYYCYWPMPFAKGIRIGLTNDSETKLTVKGRIIVEPMASLPPDTGRFFAWWHREDLTRQGKGFEILTATGRGHWCGVNHYMQAPSRSISFLEGDEMLWIDDRDNTFYNGTGTEDYFNGGWYFGATGSAPLYGCLALSDGGTCDAFRFHLCDVVPFQKKARIEIEHGGGNDHPADYAGTTFWYADPAATHTFGPVAVADRLLGPRKDQASFEAEQSFLGGGPYVQIEHNAQGVSFSSDKAVACHAKAPGGLIKLRFGAEATSRYEVRAQLLCGPDCGEVAVYVDGKRMGDVVDCYSDVRETRVLTLVQSTPHIHASGDHVMTFQVVGKSAESKGFNQAVDAVYLRRLELIEGEAMKLVSSTGGATTLQQTAPLGPDWSGDAQVVMTGSDGACFAFEMPVERSGRYYVGAYFAKGPESGKIRLSIDRGVIENEIDLADTRYHRAPMMRFGGKYDLGAGKHVLRIEFVGDELPKERRVGLDAISLEPADK